MTSPAAKAAFDIHAEPDALRDEYGRNSLGQSCLMARRLVEAGVRCVTIDHSNWDTHDDNFGTLKNTPARARRRPGHALPRPGRPRPARPDPGGRHGRVRPDAAHQQGRRPRPLGPGLHRGAGRRRHPGAASSSAGPTRAPRSRADDPHGPEDLAATIYRCLGIDPDEEFHTPEGRPVKIVNNGRVIQGLI